MEVDRRKVVEAVIADTAAGRMAWDVRLSAGGMPEAFSIWRGLPVITRDFLMTNGSFQHLIVNGLTMSDGGYFLPEHQQDPVRLSEAREHAIALRLAESHP